MSIGQCGGKSTPKQTWENIYSRFIYFFSGQFQSLFIFIAKPRARVETEHSVGMRKWLPELGTDEPVLMREHCVMGSWSRKVR